MYDFQKSPLKFNIFNFKIINSRFIFTPFCSSVYTAIKHVRPSTFVFDWNYLSVLPALLFTPANSNSRLFSNIVFNHLFNFSFQFHHWLRTILYVGTVINSMCNITKYCKMRDGRFKVRILHIILLFRALPVRVPRSMYWRSTVYMPSRVFGWLYFSAQRVCVLGLQK